jgi:hypothetical protein
MANKTNKRNKKLAGATKKNKRSTHTKKRQTKTIRQNKNKMYKRMNSALFSGIVSI